MPDNNASNLVPLGRERTGAAGIFGQPKDPSSTFFGRVRAQELQDKLDKEKAEKARLQRESEIDEFAQWRPEDPWSFFSDTVQKDLSGMRESFFKQLQANPGMSPSQVFNSPKMRQQREAIQVLSAKTRSLQEVYTQVFNDFKSGNMPNKDQSFVLGEMRKILASEDPGSIDQEQLLDIVNHPIAFKRRDFIENSVEGIQNQFDQTGDPKLRNSGIGQYIVTEQGKSRFARPIRNSEGEIVDFEMGVSAELIESILNSSPELDASVRYEIAQRLSSENGLSVDENFEAIKDDPSFIEEVYGIVETELEQFQERSTKNSVTKLGSFPRSSSIGSAGKFANVTIASAGGDTIRDLSDIGEDNIAGTQDLIVPIPRMTQQISLDVDGSDKKVFVDGFRTTDGEPVFMVSESDGSKSEIPLNTENTAAIRNSLKVSERAQFDRLINEFNARTQNQGTVSLDRDRLEGVAQEVIDEFARFPSGLRFASANTDSEVTNRISEILSGAGLDVEVEAQGNIGRNFVRVDGTSFDLGKKSDQEKFKQFIFGLDKSKFIRNSRIEDSVQGLPEDEIQRLIQEARQ
jgi:hypothetical protein